MSLLVNLFAVGVAFLIGFIAQRYYIFLSCERKTNIPFVRNFNIITGSHNILFENNKILAVNAHDRHHELGDTFGCFFGANMQVFSRDPDLIYKICVSDFQNHRNRYYVDSLSLYMKASLLEARDEKWYTSRRAVASVLKASKLKMDNVDTNIDATCSRMLSSIDRRLRTKELDPVIDVYQINKNFFMQSILKIIYDTEELVDFDKSYNDVVEEMYKFINVNYEFVARIAFLIPILTNLIRPFLGLFEHGKCLRSLTNKLDLILQRTFSVVRKKDKRLTTIHSLINCYRKGELSREQLMGNAVFLMLAGFATSVDAMSALMWELAKNPEVQDKLRTDLQQYGEESKYLEQCLNETLRLYPGSLTNRDLGEDVHHKDFKLVKGSCFNVNIYSVHRDPRYWGSDAEVWRPERFDPGNAIKFHPAQFIPFGIGPRNCVGYNLAKLELYKFTAQFFLKYKLEVCPQTQSELEFVALGALPFALPIKGPIYLRLSHASDG